MNLIPPPTNSMNPRSSSSRLSLLAVCRSQQPLVAMLLMAAFALSGCSRAFYRQQADTEAYCLIQQKANNPHWALEGYTITVDPRSRMFDPFAPDCPPMPQDDPASNEFMNCVDNKRGYPDWTRNGVNGQIENPAWAAYIATDDRGIAQVNSDDAIRLALLNSREYQQQLESLYLSALDVSFQRFEFDSQFFAGYGAFFTADGRRRSGSGGESSSILDLSTTSSGPRPWSMTKAYSTGSTLVVGLANSLVWQFSGPDDYNGTTLIDFAFVQPLLRNAGRDVVLEGLTQSERTLLADVRSLEQYRQAFYVEIMTGRSATNNLATGIGVGGYMGLLQSQQQIRNQEDNVERLRSNLFRLEQVLQELRTRSGEQGLINNILRQDLQVAQARQALFSAESQLLTSRNAYQAQLDNFKITLGLPPQWCMNVDDPMLDQFQLIDRETVNEQEVLDEVINEFGAVRLRVTSHIESREVRDEVDADRTRVQRVLAWYPELPTDLAELKDRLQPLREARERFLNIYLPRTEADVKAFEESIEHRKAFIARLKARIEGDRDIACPLLPIPDINQEIFNVQRLEVTRDELRRQLGVIKIKVEEGYGAHLDKRVALIDKVLAEGETWTPEQLFENLYEGVLYPKRAEGETLDAVTDLLVTLPSDILGMQLVQARARAESIELSSIDIRAEQAINVAREYRRDWMNARAALVDSWRQIEVQADSLESSLDIFFSGDVGNVGQNPFKLRSTTGRLRAGIQFDAPLTRLAERNNYRTALIQYQQARRNYYAFEDQVARQLRSTLRTVAANQVNFELQRLAVLEAARQIDRNEDIRIDQELNNQSSGVTAARDAVSALSDLLNAQNSFLAIWVNYESLRRSLDLDLGTLQIDTEGLWIDPGTISETYGEDDPWLRKYDAMSVEEDLEGILNGEPIGPGAPRRLDNEAPAEDVPGELPPLPAGEETRTRPLPPRVAGPVLDREPAVRQATRELPSRNRLQPAPRLAVPRPAAPRNLKPAAGPAPLELGEAMGPSLGSPQDEISDEEPLLVPPVEGITPIPVPESDSEEASTDAQAGTTISSEASQASYADEDQPATTGAVRPVQFKRISRDPAPAPSSLPAGPVRMHIE